ncbi:hypothetical protein E4U13_005900 [Claviceps humidiphila]|uniref:RRM domain-containing protein n=2 Tax=Claviceps TaxID=5110 RepID=A0A9P7PXV8_9HYPO|nr:hypothetical protein E4U57_005277 [Claviceps arundinis]KAG6109352.1 hypothetical protein E4U13_005900 [Claviceps humidiphila]
MAMESTTPQVTSAALSEGRRIYLGNLLYTAEAHDIEEAVRASGYEDFEAVHITVDATSGRNPGYCFVDFATRESADRALESLEISIGDRPLKVGPCKPKNLRTSTARWGSDNRSPSSPRWGSEEGASTRYVNGRGQGERASPPSNYVNEAVADEYSKRVYVGGLAPSVDQALDNVEMADIFAGFTPVKFSNRIKPHESASAVPGNHHYCFVDFSTKEEAQSAIDALNGKAIESGPLRVSAARPPPNKQRDQRASPYNNTNSSNNNSNNRFGDRARRSPRDQDGPQQSEALPPGSRSMAAGNWRRKDN